jgi:hypothetical protein
MTGVDTTASERTPRFSPTAKIGAVFILLLGVFWGWIWVYQLTNQGERDMPDRLDDLAWTTEATEICEAAHARVAALPGAHASATADDRADVIDAATAEYHRMLDELGSVVPTGDGRDAAIAAAWLDDYRVFLGDRSAFADALRADPMARFLVTEKYGSHITAPIDRFARVNEMESCMTPGDV